MNKITSVLKKFGFLYQLSLNGFSRILLFVVTTQNAATTDAEITGFLLHINFALSLTIVFSLGANYLASTVTDVKHTSNIINALTEQSKLLAACLLFVTIFYVATNQTEIFIFSLILQLSLVEVLNANLLVGDKWYRAIIYYSPPVLMYGTLLFYPDQFKLTILTLGICISTAVLLLNGITIRVNMLSFNLTNRLKNIVFDLPSASFLAAVLYTSSKLESVENTALLMSFVTFSGAISFIFGNFNTYYGRKLITEYSASKQKFHFWIKIIASVFIATFFILPAIYFLCLLIEPSLRDVVSIKFVAMAAIVGAFISLNIFSTLTLMHIGASQYILLSSLIPYPVAFGIMLYGYSGMFSYLAYALLKFIFTISSIAINENRRK